MSESPQEGRFDRALDAGNELTELEYHATQRQLSPDEQKRLEELRQSAGRIVKTERIKEKESAPEEGTVVSGDDSP